MKASLNQIVVQVDDSPASTERLAVACSLAQAHDAAVAALYAVTPALLHLPFAMEAGASAVSVLGDLDDDRRNAARAAFERVRSTFSGQTTWGEVSEYPILSGFSQQALFADLLVLGQHNPSEPVIGLPEDFAETVMATSGKPALVVPYLGALASMGQNVVIAWKPTRESARAVSAAVPLLQRASKVHVLSWNPENLPVTGDRLDLAGYLKLRGIDPVWHQESDDVPGSLGEVLLSRVFDLEADLLVMGCYGHSRTREWILGGTSRTVLQSMTLPVLMAH